MKKTILFILFSLLFRVGNTQIQVSWERVLNTQAIAIAINPFDDHIIYTTSGNNFVVSNDAGATWVTRNNNIPSDCHSIAISPFDTSLIVIYADGNLLRSVNGGHDWDIVLPDVSMNGETLDFHPTEPDTIFYVDFETGKLWVSDDQGENWSVRTVIADLRAVCSFTVNPNNPKQMLAGAANSNVTISNDGGFTWQAIKPASEEYTEVPKIVWDPNNPGQAYGSVFNDPQYSFIHIGENGNTYSHEGLYHRDMWALDIDPLNSYIYLGTFAGNDLGIYKSYDFGKSWQHFGDLSIGLNWMIKTASDSMVYLATLGNPTGIYRAKITERPGYLAGIVSDSVSGLVLEYFEISIVSTGDKITAANKAGTYKLALLPGTYDITYSLGSRLKTIKDVQIESGKTDTLDVQLFLDIKQQSLGGTITGEDDEPVSCIVFLEYNDVTSQDGLKSVYTDENGYFHFDSLNSLNLYKKLTIDPLVLPYFGIDTTTFNIDTMQNFQLQYADVLLANSSNDEDLTDAYRLSLEKNNYTTVSTNISSDPENIDPGIVSLTKMNTLIWFSRIDSMFTDTLILDKLQTCADAGNHIIMSGQNLVENNNDHPFFTNLGIHHAANFKIVGFVDPLLGFDNNPIGHDFSLTIRAGLQDSPDIFSGTGSQIQKAFYYGNMAADTNNIAGVSITNTGHGGKALILGFDLDYQSPGAFSEILKRSLDYFNGLINSVDKGPVFQNGYKLSHNYPNPFNPVTNFEFRISSFEFVNLTIYNLLGQKVTTLVNEKKQPGIYKVLFDASKLSSGVYYYTLKTNHYTETKKMLLIR